MLSSRNSPRAGIRHLLLATVALLGISASPAFAQDNAADPAASEPAANDGDGLSEVIVTAQRREQNLQQVPAAVTALNTETLSQRGITSALDLVQATPGLQVGVQSGGANGTASGTYFIRGMGQQRANNGSEPAVGIYVDDIYYPSLQGNLFSIVDVEQIEVLRGPQGTLFGRNTIGGAVRYTSRAPSRTFEASITGTAGSYDRRDVTGFVNAPLGDKAAFRVTAGHLERDGFARRQDGGPNAGAENTDLVRVQLRLDPTDNLRIDLTGQYVEFDLEGIAYTTPSPVNPLPGTQVFLYNQSALGLANPYDSRYNATCARCQPGSNYREFATSQVWNASAAINWEISDTVTLRSLTGYTNVESLASNDYDASALSIFHQNLSFEVEAFSQEFQLNANLFDQRLSLVTGLFFYDESFISNGLLVNEFIIRPGAGGSNTPATAIDRDTRSYAGFFDGRFAATDRLTLLFGARLSRDEKSASASRATGFITADETAFTSFTGRLGLQYQWTPEIMTYATVSEGFRSGGFNFIPAQNRFFAFEPEKSRAYEIGARLEFLNRRLRFNPTVYYNEWKDIQVQSVIAVPTGTVITFDNAARAHTYGMELEAQFAITHNFRLFGSLALLHAQYDDIGNATGITLNSNFMRAPDVTYSVGATYEQEFAGGWDATATVNYAWVDDTQSTPTDDDFMFLPSHGILNARLEISTPGNRFSIAVFGTNLTDSVYYIGGVRFSKNVGVDRVDLGRPREFGVSLRARF
jgi:iron complex outermembrane receptor protein